MAQNKSITGIKVSEETLQAYLESKLREAVKEVMEGVIEAEAQEMVRARPYERTTQRKDYRNGKRKRKLETRVGEIEIKVPRLRMIPFQSQIIDRYKRMESSLEESLVEMYLQGVSTRRVNDITEQLCGVTVTAGRMSRLNHKVYEKLEAWRNRPLMAQCPYLYLDGMVIKARWGEHVEPVWLLVAVAVNPEGYRQVVGVEVGSVEDEACWLRLLRHLKQRGLRKVGLVISDAHLGLRKAAERCFPKAQYQRCIFHFIQNVLTQVPARKRREVAAAAKAIFAQESAEEAQLKAQRFIKVFGKRFPEAVKTVRLGLKDTLTYYQFPELHWKSIRTNNPLERLLREVRRRLRVVGVFPNPESALMLATARLKWTQETKWEQRIYLNMEAVETDRKAS